MNRFFIAALGLVAFSSASFASDTISCHTQATQAVAESAGGVLMPSSDSIGARPTDAVLIIANGHMFSYRPLAGNDVRIAQELGHKIREQNLLWRTEYDRCLGGEHGIVVVRY
jgi:hypothetical protein